MAELTSLQATAVNWGTGSLLILAGPGSGKTRVLTTRLARLLAESQGDSFRVLALTFTNKAADEMSARVTALVPDQEHRAFIGTFHSFCMQILQQHGSHVGIRPDFAIYSQESDRIDLLKDALRSASVTGDAKRYLAAIDKMLTRLIQPEGCARYFRESSVGEQVEAVYTAYELELAKVNALDFGSLIARAHKLIKDFPGIAVRYRKTYSYWMFDEYQDTNDGQYRLLKSLAGNSFRNIVAVADDDQIIYQWNGASYQQIQRFRSDFTPKELQLPTNYRCPPGIVFAANNLVVHNANRTTWKAPLEPGKTKLWYPAEEHISVTRFTSDEAEATGIANTIAASGPDLFGKTAVIARSRATLEKIQDALKAQRILTVIAQRRDDFRSPQFLWMTAVLRLTLRPSDRGALEAVAGTFNRWFGTKIRVDELVNDVAISSRSYLDEWAFGVESSCTLPALELARLAAKCGKEPSRFREFIENVLSGVSDEIKTRDTSAEIQDDLSEDRAAWTDLARSIYSSIGRDAPLEHFLQELTIRSKEPPADSRAVTLMTIHGAKGKEFDHVHVAGLAEDVLPSFQSIRAGENSPEMEEERRNCFVAITRARERLRLSFADKYRGWKKQPSRFLSEMKIDVPPLPAQ